MTVPNASRIAPDSLPAENRLQAMLVKIEYAAKDINLLTLAGVAREPLPAAEPGAHIGLFLPNGMERQYSLVLSDEAPRTYTIGVKKDANSRGGSRFVHENLRVGDRIYIAPPRNNFPLREAADFSILFAGGIGITPIFCMFRKLCALGKNVELHYASRSRDEAAFLGELAGDPRAKLHFDDEIGAILPIAELVAKAAADAHLYCCGPAPMLSAFEQAAKDRPSSHVHVEYFTPKFEAAVSGGFVVELARSKQEFQILPGQSILETLRSAGIDVSYSCEQGICGSCETRVVSGEPDHRDSILSESERQANNTMMICCSGSKGGRLVLDL